MPTLLQTVERATPTVAENEPGQTSSKRRLVLGLAGVALAVALVGLGPC